MAAPAQTSKSTKKKAVKAIERTESPAPSTAASASAEKAGDDSSESLYIKELQKNIRNVNKKIANASKTDALLNQHAGKSLDDLVAEKIINTDQKAQILKKPALQAQLAQFEEQLTQYQKVDEQYKIRAAADKAEFEKTLEKVKAEAVAEAKASFDQTLKDNLLVLSQFLRLAAHRREEARDPESDESQAVEGVLLAIYAGEQSAVEAMLKLVNGTDDQVVSVPGEQLQTTYAQVKALAQDNTLPLYTEGAQPTEGEPVEEVVTDPTIANAAATEIEAGDATALVNGQSSQPAANGLANASVSDEAANAVAESHWDAANNDSTISQEWVDVKVPRDPAETETGLNATPAVAANTQSWADDPDHEKTPAPADPNDGFHQVQRNRPRNEREGGNHRGRGRGDHRGRGGFRGDGRGRGRGGRGGPSSRGRRNEEP